MFHLFGSPSSYATRVKFDRESAKRDKCCPCERQTKCLEIWILLMSSLPPSGVVIAAQTCKISGDLEGPFVKIGLALLPSLPPIIWRVPFAASGRGRLFALMSEGLPVKTRHWLCGATFGQNSSSQNTFTMREFDRGRRRTFQVGIFAT